VYKADGPEICHTHGICFFGSRIMFAEFSLSKPWEFSENMLLIAAVMSSLIIPQQVLKKSLVNPSGPGALSDDMEFIVSLISSYVNGASSADRSLGTYPYPSASQLKVLPLCVTEPRWSQK